MRKKIFYRYINMYLNALIEYLYRNNQENVDRVILLDYVRVTIEDRLLREELKYLMMNQ